MSSSSNVRVIRCDERAKLPDALQSMLQEESLCDVTICCDGQHVKAHRLILAASSSYFKNVFSTALPVDQHSVVSDKSISIQDLKTILEFIYKGEVTVEQKRMNSLKSSAAKLGVAGFDTNSRDYVDFNGSALTETGKIGKSVSQNHLAKSSVQKAQEMKKKNTRENGKPTFKINNSQTKTAATSSALTANNGTPIQIIPTRARGRPRKSETKDSIVPRALNLQKVGNSSSATTTTSRVVNLSVSGSTANTKRGRGRPPKISSMSKVSS